MTDEVNIARSKDPELGASSPTNVLVTTHDLLSVYSQRLQTWMKSLYDLALMNRSLFARDVIAYSATHHKYDASALYERLKLGNVDKIHFRHDWLHHLGRVIAFQNIHESDIDFALRCLAASTNSVALRSTKAISVQLRIELHAAVGDFQEALFLLEEYADLIGEEYHELATDLYNPFVNANGWDTNTWLREFNAPIEESGLSPVYLQPIGSGSPFDALGATASSSEYEGGPLVSVIMTSYAPDETAFEVAVKSILDQSWKNLELIVVDDASPGGPPKILDALAAEDSRVRVIVLEENRGTYYARNVGLKAAHGVYATGQDSDDWSHPDRIKIQVDALEDEPSLAGVLGHALRSDANLYRVTPGKSSRRICEVSLMFPTSLAREVGGYIESRKGADSEFRLRLEQYTRSSVKRLPHLLYFTRLSTGSLSRDEFKVGWAHQTRRAFSNFMHHWHENSQPEELLAPKDQELIPGIPEKFRSLQREVRRYDYVFLSDWRWDDATTTGALEELRSLRGAGYAVAIMQLNGTLPEPTPSPRLTHRVQEYINDGFLDLVVTDENAQIETLVVKRAELLQFAPNTGFGNHVGKLVVMANLAPSGWDGTEPIYSPEYCSEVAEQLFGTRPVWVAQDPAIHRYFGQFTQELNLWHEVVPYVAPDMSGRSTYRAQRSRSSVPVIGRTGNNLEMLWPEERKAASNLWPSNRKQSEVRIWGTKNSYARKFGKSTSTAQWRIRSMNSVPMERFCEGLDYFIYFPDMRWPQELSYEAFVAFSRGATVILPPHFASNHPGTAVFLDPADVPNFVEWDWLTGNALEQGNILHPSKVPTNGSEFVKALEQVSRSIDVKQ